MKSVFVRLFATMAAAVCVMFAAACATSAPPVQPIQSLRVGFSPNYPPVCFETDGKPTGLEADLAAALSDELGCSFEIVSMEFDELIPALLDGRVDILMSGLTVTPTRAYKVRFCKPYCRNPLVAVTQAAKAHAYNYVADVFASSSPVGVLRHTYAETFVRQHFHRARVVPISDYDNVPEHMASHRYALYVDDLAAVLDLADKHADVLGIIPFPLQQQDIAWAVHPDNPNLLSAANAALDKWKTNGRLDAILDRWLPGRFR